MIVRIKLWSIQKRLTWSVHLLSLNIHSSQMCVIFWAFVSRCLGCVAPSSGICLYMCSFFFFWDAPEQELFHWGPWAQAFSLLRVSPLHSAVLEPDLYLRNDKRHMHIVRFKLWVIYIKIDYIHFYNTVHVVMDFSLFWGYCF